MFGNDKMNRYQCHLKTVLRMLRNLRDFYIRSMEYCDGRVSPLSAYVPSTIPRSFSVHKDHEEDYRKLIRAASTRGRLIRVDDGNKVRILQQSHVSKMPTRSYSLRPVAICRIDEDHEADFREENSNLYPRSRSYAVQRTIGGLL